METNELKKQFEKQRKLQKEFQENGQKLLKETFNVFFKLNPGVNAVCWTQYTPYYNDGDECNFLVYKPYFTNAIGEDLEYIDNGLLDADKEGIWIVNNVGRILESDKEYYAEDKAMILSGPSVDAESCDLLSEMIQSDEFEDIMKLMFGDHAEITATRQGFDISDYEHE